jgi:hypothetical protein
MSNADAYKKLLKNRKEAVESAGSEPIPEPTVALPTPTSNHPKPTTAAALSSEPKKRGRPATGKRSDDAWIGRTFYVKRETDLDIEDELLNLKRQGIEIDKSELVDYLLAAWVKWRKGEDSEFLLGEISPRRK